MRTKLWQLVCVCLVVFAIVFTASVASAQSFGALAGTAVTCTNSTVNGDVGVWPGTAVTQTSCVVTGAVHTADGVAQQAFMNFVNAHSALAPQNGTCDAAHTLTGTLSGEVLLPGTYCLDAVAKTGTLLLDAQGDADAEWLFLVAGALTGTNFTVVMMGDGNPCNVTWWVAAAATMTTSNLMGTVLAGAAITLTGGTLHGNALAMAAVTLTDTVVTACNVVVVPPPPVCKPCRHHKDDSDDDHGHHKGDHHVNNGHHDDDHGGKGNNKGGDKGKGGKKK